MSYSIDDQDDIDNPKISSITQTAQIRDLENLQTQRLLSRLFQELDDENTDLETLESLLNKIATDANIDYKQWSNENTSICLKDRIITKSDDHVSDKEDLLSILLKRKRASDGTGGLVSQDDERALLLHLLNREKKLSQQYESLLSSYEELLTYTAIAARDRREDTFGIYADSPSLAETEESRQSVSCIQSIQISHNLKNRAQALKSNTEMLKGLARNKRIQMNIVKNRLREKALGLRDSLNDAADTTTTDDTFTAIASNRET